MTGNRFVTLHSLRSALVFAVLSLASCTLCPAQEWTRFRGPNGSGVSDAATIPVQWKQSDYNWAVSLPGYGHSSPVVWDGRVFVTSANEEQATRYLLCIDADGGGVVWQREFEFAEYKHHKNNSSASGTPAVDANHVYVLWQSKAESPLVALDHAGREVWRYDLGPYLHGQGPGTSPIVYQDLLFLWADTGIVSCVRAASGDVIWRERAGGNYFSSPVCVDGKLYGVELDGEVVVLRAAAEYELLARNPLPGPSRATPAVSGGVMYLRTYSHLCSLGGKPSQ